MAITHERTAARQADLLNRANTYLAGGGLGLFVLPPEVNLVISEGHGSHVTDVLGTTASQPRRPVKTPSSASGSWPTRGRVAGRTCWLPTRTSAFAGPSSC